MLIVVPVEEILGAAAVVYGVSRVSSFYVTGDGLNSA